MCGGRTRGLSEGGARALHVVALATMQYEIASHLSFRHAPLNKHAALPYRRHPDLIHARNL